MLTEFRVRNATTAQATEMVGWIAVCFDVTATLISGTVSALTILAGHKQSHKTSHTFRLVVACVDCISMALGTILGVFTLMTLSRPEVKEMCERRPDAKDAIGVYDDEPTADEGEVHVDAR